MCESLSCEKVVGARDCCPISVACEKNRIKCEASALRVNEPDIDRNLNCQLFHFFYYFAPTGWTLVACSFIDSRFQVEASLIVLDFISMFILCNYTKLRNVGKKELSISKHRAGASQCQLVQIFSFAFLSIEANRSTLRIKTFSKLTLCNHNRRRAESSGSPARSTRRRSRNPLVHSNSPLDSCTCWSLSDGWKFFLWCT